MTPALTSFSIVRLHFTRYAKLILIIPLIQLITVSHAQIKERKIYVQVEDTATPPFSIENTNITIESHCTAPFNGAIQFDISGGSGSYTLNWTSPNGFSLTTPASAGTYTLSNLENGFYYVIIEDGSGCKVNQDFFVARDGFACYPGPGCSLNITDISSHASHGCGGSLGDIHFESNGYNVANPDFNYEVSGPNTFFQSGTAIDGDNDDKAIVDIYNLPRGTYHVVVNFINPCSTSPATAEFDVEVKPWYFYDGAYVSGEVSDCLNPDGALFIGQLMDGSGNMAYTLTGPNGYNQDVTSGSSQTISGLSAGVYVLTIDDNDFPCSQIDIYEIPMAASVVNEVTISIDDFANNSKCEAPYNGFITIEASGGTGNYSYHWRDESNSVHPSTSASATDLYADPQTGTRYYATVIDNESGCSVMTGYDIYTENPLDDPNGVQPGFPTFNTNCSSPYNGVIPITISSSPGPFEYTFYPLLDNHNVPDGNSFLPATTPFVTSTATDVPPGSYYLEAKDISTGCKGFASDSDDRLIVGPFDNSTPTLNVVIDNVSPDSNCGLPANGAAAITITTPQPSNIIWKNLEDLTTYTVEDPANLTSGVYELTVSIACVVGANLPAVLSSSVSSLITNSNTPLVLNSSISITDANDTNLEGAMISISNGFIAAEDQLTFINQNGITGSYNSSSGILTLTGSATKANYETALRSVSYISIATPTFQPRSISFSVFDGEANSNTITTTITINNQSPALSGITGFASFAPASGPSVIASTLLTTDPDNANLQSATVRITPASVVASEDQLLFNNQNNITGTYNTSTGQLSLTGNSSIANYQIALRSIRYDNSAAVPNTQNRTVEFQVNDGNSNSALINKQIQVLLSNDPPVISPKPVTTRIDSVVTINLAALINDPNNNIDLSTLKIVQQPLSGAPASINSSFELVVDYSGSRFAGNDRLRISVCDLLAACVESDITITVEGDIIVYNGFSPNGDGSNPFFLIQNIESLEPQNKVSIFNRWGDKIFEVDDYDNDARKFTGENKNGNDVSTGTYFYKIEFTSGRPTLTGYLSLKR